MSMGDRMPWLRGTIVLLCLGAIQTWPQDYRTGGLEIDVSLNWSRGEHAPAAGALVTLKGPEGGVAGRTSPAGRVRFDYLVAGSYAVSIGLRGWCHPDFSVNVYVAKLNYASFGLAPCSVRASPCALKGKTVQAAADAPGGSSIVALGSENGDLMLCRPNQSPEIWRAPKPGYSVSALEFSADGLLLASGGKDAAINVWDVPTGKVLVRFEQQNDVTLLRFSPGNRYLVSADDNGRVFVWEPRSPQPIQSGQAKMLKSIEFTPDGKFVVLLGDRKLQYLPLP